MEQLSKRDRAFAGLLSVALLVVYSVFRVSEISLDSPAIIGEVMVAINKGYFVHGTPREYLSSLSLQFWLQSFGKLPFFQIEAPPLQNEMLSALNAGAALNALCSSLTAAFIFMIGRRLRMSFAGAALAALLFGLAGATWMLASTVERQPLPVALITAAILTGSFAGAKNRWVAWAACLGALSLASLAVLTYMAVGMFLPLAALITAMACQRSDDPAASMRRLWWSVGIWAVAVYAIFFASDGPSAMLVAAQNAIAEFTQFAGAGADLNYWTQLTEGLIVHTALSYLFYFGGYMGIVGVHDIGFLSYTSGHASLFVLSAVIGILLLSFNASQVFQFVMARGLVNRLRAFSLDPALTFTVVAGASFLAALVITGISRVAISTEFWYISVWAGLFIVMHQVTLYGRRAAVFWGVLLSLLLGLNLHYASNNFLSLTFDQRTKYFRDELISIESLLAHVEPSDVLFIQGQDPTYGFRIISRGRIYTWPLDSTNFDKPEALAIYIDLKLAKGKRFLVLGDVWFGPTNKNLQAVYRRAPLLAGNLAYLKSRFELDGFEINFGAGRKFYRLRLKQGGQP